MANNRLIVFVDGSNFLIELSKNIGVGFRADKPPWPAVLLASQLIRELTTFRHLSSIRRYWFASYQGDENFYNEYRITLRQNNFEPVLFKKRNGKEKGVDIALTKEMLVNAFNQNFDHGILIAGDEDYVGLVNETKRYGQIIDGAFFPNGLSNNLRLSFDHFSLFEGTIYQDKLDEFKVKIKQCLNKK